MASGRPLLVCGEPGIGKTQLALAVASVLDCGFVYEVVNSKSQSADLLYTYDTVARLGEAQLLSSLKSRKRANDRLAPNNFITPGVLWWAFDKESALEQYEKSNKSCRKPLDYELSKFNNGVVALIDEIDKADSDLPNGLLETLGNYSFTVPYVAKAINGNKDNTLVIITTNNERALPQAFIRRCIVLNMFIEGGSKDLKNNEEALVSRLSGVAEAHATFKDLKPAFIKEVAKVIHKERMEQSNQNLKPSIASFVDLLNVITSVSESPENALKKYNSLVLKKDINEYVDE